MMLTENLEALHREEDRLRGDHINLVTSRADLSAHLGIISKAMNMIWAFTHDHPHKSDDELTMQMLGVRLFNAAAASVKLAFSGYYQNAFSALRDFLETSFLVDYLRSNPDQISAWKVASKAEIKGKFGPNSVRQALDKRDGFKKEKRKELYDLISHHATHATPGGIKMTVVDALGEIGPFYSEANFQAWAEEAVKMLGGTGSFYCQAFSGISENLKLVRDDYYRDFYVWTQKYLHPPKA